MFHEMQGPLAAISGWLGVLLASVAIQNDALTAAKDIGSWAVIVYLVIWWTRRQEKIFSNLVEELREMRRDIQNVIKDLEDK